MRGFAQGLAGGVVAFIALALLSAWGGAPGPQDGGISGVLGDARWLNVSGEASPVSTTSASAAAIEASAGGITFSGDLTDTGASSSWTVNDGSGIRMGQSAAATAVGSSGGFWALRNLADGVGLELTGRTTTGAGGFRRWNLPFTAGNSYSASSSTQYHNYDYADLHQTSSAGFDGLLFELIETSTGSGARYFARWKSGTTSGALADKFAVYTDGGIQGGYLASATPATATTFGTCAAALAAKRVTVDDTNDGATAFECFCGKGADDATYAWRRVDAPGTTCP